MVDHEWIEPEVIQKALRAIFSAQIDPNTKSGRYPSWVERIRGVIKGRENEFISLRDFADVFPGPNPKTKRKNAASAISWLNAQFRGLGIDLELVSENPNRYRDAQTDYHFRRPSQHLEPSLNSAIFQN